MAMAKALVFACAFSVAAVAVVTSESASEPLARGLETVMREQTLDAIAANDPDQPDRFVAALLFPGQLLAVSARYPAPALLLHQLSRRAYGEVYAALHGASIRETLFFVQDMGADGLQSEGDSVDVVYENVGEHVIFDGHPEKQKLSKSTYHEKFRKADARYSQVLKLLVDAVKNSRPVLATRGQVFQGVSQLSAQKIRSHPAATER
jgi:hypothetical protein